MKEEATMTTRRQFIQSVSAAGVLLATSGRLARAAVPAMTKRAQAATTPDKALQMLKEGNKRFVSGRMHQRDLMVQVKATASGQYPFAVVIGCIDSRVSNELVFDQGIGDIFSARVAGNFVNDDILGSLEFACKVAGAKLIVVLGHTECGAVKGACDDVVMGNLTQTLANIKPAVTAVSGFRSDRTSSNRAFVQAVTAKNVAMTVQRIRQRSPILADMADNGGIRLVGAMYDVGTGKVTFL